MDPDLGAGVELTPTCWGMHVDLVEEKPGQPPLTAGCTITAIDGQNLLGLANEDPRCWGNIKMLGKWEGRIEAAGGEKMD